MPTAPRSSCSRVTPRSTRRDLPLADALVVQACVRHEREPFGRERAPDPQRADHETEEETLRRAPAQLERFAQGRRKESGGDDVGRPVEGVRHDRERMEHRARDDAAGDVGHGRGLEHVSLVALEVADRPREEVVRYAELTSEDLALVPVPLAVGRRETAGDELVPPERREHERRLHPQEQLRIARSVAASILSGALHAHVPRVDPPQRASCASGRPEYRVERRVGGPVEAPEGIAPKVRMLIDPGGDERMRHLQQHRRGAAERDEQLAIEAPRHRVSRKDPDVRHTRSVSLIRSFGFALEGVSYLIRTQRNARIELAVGLVVLIVAIWVRVTAVEWAVLALTTAIVLALEALNTALELAVTLASPERHPLAKAAKDVSAATVLIAAIGAVLVGIAIFRPHLDLWAQ